MRIAWRNLTKSKTSSIINIAGLATGMAIALIIGFWIADELSFDHYHSNHSRIAKAMMTQHAINETYTGEVVSMQEGRAFETQYKDLFSKVGYMCGGDNELIAYGDKKILAKGMWGNYELAEMFTLRILQGSMASFKDPSTVLLSQSLATTLFGFVFFFFFFFWVGFFFFFFVCVVF